MNLATTITEPAAAIAVRIAPRDAFASWTAAATANSNKFAAGYFCHPAGHREPCPNFHLFGEFRRRAARTRGAAPTWKNSTVLFGKPPPWRPVHPGVANFTVSRASVLSARSISNAERSRPAEVKPVWKKPAEETIDYVTRFDVMLDGLFDESGVASSRRSYSDDEIRIAERWDSALFSDVKHGAATEHGATERGELHKFDLWPFFTMPVGRNNEFDLTLRPLTSQEAIAGFATMTALVDVVATEKDLKNLCNAKTATGRAIKLRSWC